MLIYDVMIERQKEMNIAHRDLAEKAGVSLPTIQKVYRGEDISMANLNAICFALDLIPTAIDRSVIAQQELEAKEAEIDELMDKLEALERERDAIKALIK